jgi:hypothetical protein
LAAFLVIKMEGSIDGDKSGGIDGGKYGENDRDLTLSGNRPNRYY